ncbi:hypothetical protein [Eel River basin pequenovirus]|nr:hypothetical protein [Eel River basin pequenovirus]
MAKNTPKEINNSSSTNDSVIAALCWFYRIARACALGVAASAIVGCTVTPAARTTSVMPLVSSQPIAAQPVISSPQVMMQNAPSASAFNPNAGKPTGNEVVIRLVVEQ